MGPAWFKAEGASPMLRLDQLLAVFAIAPPPVDQAMAFEDLVGELVRESPGVGKSMVSARLS